ncbi:MAG TPA: alpha-ketoglutarate-dependent dioxygenase AlkB [Terriglobales bacterium]|nr:alpha-ketoglutarate-dependent dioxygenase AlkB [Terriglobales bacterium]
MDAPPPGFRYVADFVERDEETALLELVRALPFSDVVMRGQVARRRTAHFGWRYGYESFRVDPGPPIPAGLLPLRARAAALIAVDDAALEEALVTVYPRGAGIGWHRDAPAFGLVVGISLASACRFRFQRGAGDRRRTAAVVLEPRSAYVLTAEARWQWQHTIPPMAAERYSITFRTLAQPRARSARTAP